MSFRKPNRVYINRIWTWPIIIALFTVAGLISALLADGWADAAAWVGLGIPVMVVIYFVLRMRPPER